ncbi:MAG: PD-(D/E)XK nuclease family protein [Colwellia sp.]|nr:PD-(D/E)XK nuclease family protein [Colwellia sp.]
MIGYLKTEITLQSDAVVFTEYKNIDILIKSGDTAIIIENKIYAADREKQLTRYHNLISAEGFNEIHLVYLTLDGSEPSKSSTEGLDLETVKLIKCLSYELDIYEWLEKCLSKSVKEPTLRESFVQYIEIIEKLTGKVKSVTYMNGLKELMMEGENLADFLDLQKAYNEVIIDHQVELWKLIQEEVKFLGELSEDSISSDIDKKKSIQNFMEGRKNSNYFGLFYFREGESFHISIEMQGEGIIAGVCCSKEENPEKYNNLVNQLEAAEHQSQRSKWWPCYRYIEPYIHYKALTRDNLFILASKDAKKEIAKNTAEYLKSIIDIIGNRK